MEGGSQEAADAGTVRSSHRETAASRGPTDKKDIRALELMAAGKSMGEACQLHEVPYSSFHRYVVPRCGGGPMRPQGRATRRLSLFNTFCNEWGFPPPTPGAGIERQRPRPGKEITGGRTSVCRITVCALGGELTGSLWLTTLQRWQRQ